VGLKDGPAEPWRGSPFSVKTGRSVWSAASDGCWLVFVKKDLNLPLVDTRHLNQALKYLQYKPQGVVQVDLTNLKEWAGPLPDTREFEVEDQRRGIIFRVVLNMKRLACLLEHVTDKSFSLWDGTGTGVRSVGLSGDNWRIVLGGLDRDPDEPVEEDEDPIVTYDPKPKSAFDAAMALLED